MAVFQECIVVNQKSLDFEFMEVCNPCGPKYFVTVCKDCEQIVFFEMKKALSGWSIVPPAPSWIYELREVLEGTIANNLSKGG